MRILVADNNRLFLEAATDALTQDGHEILTALDGLEVLDRIHSARPDCCVLDVLMPGLNGDRLCASIKTDPELKATPVILVTGMAGEIAGEAAPRLVAEAVLALLDRGRVDLTVPDLGMPGIPGSELARRAKTAAKVPAVALITARGADGEDRTLRAVGVDLVLNKPFEVSDAVSQLESLARP